ncbi:MAG: hypothetical protein JXA18_03765 [Chitinispirillaceae bacterium]|nr:hypothetical protein [Chitinispirillaceae bacterium]
MKRAIAVLIIVGWVLSVFAAEPRYIGAAKCAKMCHKGEKKGSQYEIWRKSKHAGAFTTLGTDSSKAVAKTVNVTGDPQKAPECLRCHVTAFGVKKELIDSTCTYSDGVGCEACHGPGSEYRKLNVMKKHDMAVSAGLWEQKEAVCTRCHNKESPTYKPFDYSEAVKKDAHPVPAKTANK